MEQTTPRAETGTPDDTGGLMGRTAADLKGRFAGSGCVARPADYARLFPGVPTEIIEQALHRLCEEGVAQLKCLSGGDLAFFFPRR